MNFFGEMAEKSDAYIKMPKSEESFRGDANETGGVRDNASHAGSTTEPEV